MNFFPDNWTNLLSQKDLFLEKTLAQIEKDAQGLAEFSGFNWEGSNSIETVLDWVESILFSLLEVNEKQLFQFLYRVDVSEQKSQSILLSRSKEKLRELALLILQREAQKVYWRSQF